MPARVRLLPVAGLLLALVACSSMPASQPVIDEQTRAELMGIEGTPIFAFTDVQVWDLDDAPSMPRYMVDYYREISAKVRGSGLFLEQPLSDQPTYRLHIGWDFEIPGNEAAHATREILRAFTLFMVPAKSRTIHRLRAELRENGKLLSSYEYEEAVEYVSTFLNDNDVSGPTWFHAGINPILERLFLDLKRDGHLDYRGTLSAQH